MAWLSRRSSKQTGHLSGKSGVVGQKLIFFFLTKHKVENKLNLRPFVPRSAVCQGSRPPPNNLAGSFIYLLQSHTWQRKHQWPHTYPLCAARGLCFQLPTYPQARIPRWEAPDGLLGRASPRLSTAGVGSCSLGTRPAVVTAPPPGSLAHCLTVLLGEGFSLYPLGMLNCGFFQGREEQNGKIYWVLYVCDLSSLGGSVVC